MLWKGAGLYSGSTGMGSFPLPVAVLPVAVETNGAQLFMVLPHETIASLWGLQILQLWVPQLLFVGLTELQL